MKPVKLSLLLLVLVLLLLCSACGAQPHLFPLVEGDTGANENMDFTVKKDTPLSNFLPQLSQVLVYTSDGEIIRSDSDLIVFSKNGRVKVEGTVYDGLHGLVVNPPEHSVMDVFDLSKEVLDSGDRLTVVFLDGLGYDNYEKALERGVIPSLARLSSRKATGVFPTITPVNYAAMVTGQPPAVSGVTRRGVHDLDCETIFDYALHLGKSVFIAEGDIQILSFSVDQALNFDEDGDGDTDNEVLKSALAQGQGPDFLFVHFHGIDDVSHATGPDSPETMAKIQLLDGHVGQLMEERGGRFIIAADHGQHQQDGIGDELYADKQGIHGAFVSQDLFIPLLTN